MVDCQTFAPARRDGETPAMCRFCGQSASHDNHKDPQHALARLEGLASAAPGVTVQADPPPQPGKPAVWDLVIEDMRQRDGAGAAKYGTRLQAGNGRDALTDAYQEALDLTVYLRQAIEERKVWAEQIRELIGGMKAQNGLAGTRNIFDYSPGIAMLEEILKGIQS